MDATYKIVGDKLELYPQTPRAAEWIRTYLTSNVAEVLYLEQEYGMYLVRQMQHFGLQVAEAE